jgi:hypothetical protein
MPSAAEAIQAIGWYVTVLAVIALVVRAADRLTDQR